MLQGQKSALATCPGSVVIAGAEFKQNRLQVQLREEVIG